MFKRSFASGPPVHVREFILQFLMRSAANAVYSAIRGPVVPRRESCQLRFRSVLLFLRGSRRARGAADRTPGHQQESSRVVSHRIEHLMIPASSNSDPVCAGIAHR